MHPAEEEDQAGEKIESPEEEAKPMGEIRRPDMPTQAEIDKHRIDHILTEVGVQTAWKVLGARERIMPSRTMREQYQ